MASGRAIGRKARASGDRFEAAVAARHASYAAQGRALVYKRPTPVKPISGGSPFRAVWQAKAGADFGGVLRGGRAALVEVKTSGSASLPLTRRGDPTVGPLQARELATCCDLGGLAGVLVAVTPAAGVRWFWLAWPAWVDACAAAESADRASLGCGLLAEYGVEVHAGDWLTGVDAAGEDRGRDA